MDDLIKLAQQAGAGVVYDGSVSAFSKEELAEFARLIRADERERIAAADAEAVPVAWLKEWVSDTSDLRRLDFTSHLEAYMPNDATKVTPLYARPQPADVGVLVEALRMIADGAHAAGDIAQEALAELEAKR